MTWREKFMKNMVTFSTLQKLVGANILKQMEIDNWKIERGY